MPSSSFLRLYDHCSEQEILLRGAMKRLVERGDEFANVIAEFLSKNVTLDSFVDTDEESHAYGLAVMPEWMRDIWNEIVLIRARRDKATGKSVRNILEE